MKTYTDVELDAISDEEMHQRCEEMHKVAVDLGEAVREHARLLREALQEKLMSMEGPTGIQ